VIGGARRAVRRTGRHAQWFSGPTSPKLMERLCALVPKPRKHLVTYHGVLAPASGLRSRVVPRRVEAEGEAGGCRHGAGRSPAGQDAAEAAVGKAVEDAAAAATAT
jgi:hypothetical protein